MPTGRGAARDEVPGSEAGCLGARCGASSRYFFASTACAAASLAIGTRKGEQLT